MKDFVFLDFKLLVILISDFGSRIPSFWITLKILITNFIFAIVLNVLVSDILV
jgi:hypothetical protein